MHCGSLYNVHLLDVSDFYKSQTGIPIGFSPRFCNEETLQSLHQTSTAFQHRIFRQNQKALFNVSLIYLLIVSKQTVNKIILSPCIRKGAYSQKGNRPAWCVNKPKSYNKRSACITKRLSYVCKHIALVNKHLPRV